MKNIFLTFILLFTVFNSNSQESSNSYQLFFEFYKKNNEQYELIWSDSINESDNIKRKTVLDTEVVVDNYSTVCLNGIALAITQHLNTQPQTTIACLYEDTYFKRGREVTQMMPLQDSVDVNYKIVYSFK